MILDYEKNFNDADFGIGNGIGLCKLQCKWWWSKRWNAWSTDHYIHAFVLNVELHTVCKYTYPTDGSNSAEMEEKLVCKILPGGKLMLTHKNVVFDDAVSIKMETTLVGNKLIVTENADYGVSGNYGYYTLNTTVGTLKDGNYTIVVMRNQNVRAEFQMSYDSSKAKNQ